MRRLRWLHVPTHLQAGLFYLFNAGQGVTATSAYPCTQAVRTRPSRYGRIAPPESRAGHLFTKRKIRRPLVLIDRGAARAADVRLHGLPDKYAAGIHAKRLDGYVSRAITVAEGEEEGEGGQDHQQPGRVTKRRVRRPRAADDEGVGGRSGNPLRWVAVSRVPWLKNTGSGMGVLLSWVRKELSSGPQAADHTSIFR